MASTFKHQPPLLFLNFTRRHSERSAVEKSDLQKKIPYTLSGTPPSTHLHESRATSDERRLRHGGGFFFILAELDAYLLAHSPYLHRYPEQHIRNAHRAFGVSNYYEL